jgi:hypothetical protein
MGRGKSSPIVAQRIYFMKEGQPDYEYHNIDRLLKTHLRIIRTEGGRDGELGGGERKQ